MNNIKLDSNINIRDLGGLKSSNGIVKKKQFIRSANLNSLTENDKKVLKEEHNLKTIIDLRNNHERKSLPDVKIKKVKYYHIPILSSNVEGITRDNKAQKVKVDKVPNMSDLYIGIVSNYSSITQLKKVLKVIMKEKNRCVLFHCSVGKDRTGIIALLILSMLDVDIETIKQDYLYTNIVNEEEANKNYEYLLEKTHDEEFAKNYKEIYLAKEEYLASAINYMIEEYGSIKNYIIYELGISEKQIDQFKENSLEKIDKNII